jgi:hypothetical protein
MKPLSKHALAELRDIVRAPVPRCGVNPGVARKLEAEGLVEEVQLRSPFKVHKGGNTAHLQATAAGIDRAAPDQISPVA